MTSTLTCHEHAGWLTGTGGHLRRGGSSVSKAAVGYAAARYTDRTGGFRPNEAVLIFVRVQRFERGLRPTMSESLSIPTGRFNFSRIISRTTRFN